jgi:hypothetical protein
MAITVYSDIILPARVVSAIGLSGKVRRHNTRNRSDNGAINVNIDWARSLQQYEFGAVPMDVSWWQQLEGLFEVTDAGAYGFLLEDPKDTDVSTGLLYPVQGGVVGGTIGLGYGVPTYRTYKRYSALGTTRTKDRAVRRPQPTPVLTRAGTPVVLGAGAGEAGINLDTGTVTFVADATRNVTGVTVGASTTIVLATALPAVSIGGRLYLTGLAGANASLLNNLSHPVTNVSGSTYTLGTNTSGTTITTGTGVGYQYPQPTQALAWTGKRYFAVHFANDDLDWSLVRPGLQENSRLFAGPSIVLDEVPE